MSGDDRFSRQVRFAPIGEAGQERIAAARVGIAGLGAIGTVIADQLARSGVGLLRIIDRDLVEYSNLQRQTLFDQSDARDGLPKAVAAERKLRTINPLVEVEARVDDLNAEIVEEWIEGLDLILDGLDNFETRFVLNDATSRAGIPWVYGAAVGSYGLTFPILPEGPCLRCAIGALPLPACAPTCDTQGVIAPITAIVASLEVSCAMRLITGNLQSGESLLTTVNVWPPRFQSMTLLADPACPLCVGGKAEYLGRDPLRTIALCGRNAVQVIPGARTDLDLAAVGRHLESYGPVEGNEFLLRCSNPPYELTLFRDGRAIVRGTEEAAVARSVYSQMIGT